MRYHFLLLLMLLAAASGADAQLGLSPGGGGGGGAGTVTSVDVSGPPEMTVGGGPITTTGTITLDWAPQAAVTVFAGPGGGSGPPTFRTLVTGDIPALAASKITSGSLAVARGGTGLSGASAGNGTLLIGNGTGYSLANMTAGTGTVVTNGSGSISLATLSRQTFSNADASVTASAHAVIVVAQTGTMSAARVLTLPAASALAAGQRIVVIDESRTVTGTFTIAITRAGSDTVCGGTSYTMSRADQPVVLESDGSTKWNLASTDSLPTYASGWLKNDGTTASWSSITSGDVSGLGGMATQSASAVAITGGAIDGTTIGATTRSTGKFTTLDALQASIAAQAPLMNLATTWNNAGVAFSAFILNVTNTNSSSASLLMDLQVAGSSEFKVDRTGSITTAGNGTINGTVLGNAYQFQNGQTGFQTTQQIYRTNTTGGSYPFDALGHMVYQTATAAARDHVFAAGTSTAVVARITSTGDVQAETGNLIAHTAGKGLQVKEGSNAKMGTAILVGGTVTVSNTSVTASSRIFLTVSAAGGTQGNLRTTKSAATSFTITSTSGTETSTVDWMIVEPAP